jgi:hypothetical protein
MQEPGAGDGRGKEGRRSKVEGRSVERRELNRQGAKGAKEEGWIEGWPQKGAEGGNNGMNLERKIGTTDFTDLHGS